VLAVLIAVPIARVSGIDVLSSGAEVRRIRHAGGESEVPVRPDRVASVGYLITDALVAMGRPPVVADEPHDQLAALPEMEALGNTASLGTLSSPNVEAVIAADPEVVLIHEKFAGRRTLRRLRRVAPTVVLTARHPVELTAQVGLVLAREIDAAEAIHRYREELRRARAEVAAAREAGESAAFLRVRPRVVRLYAATTGPGRILYDELGLEPGSSVPLNPDELWVNLSLEELRSIEADHLFLGIDPGAGDRGDDVRDHPLWNSLPAVQAGNVYEVRSMLWIAGDDGPIGARHIRRDVVRALGR
jgi:iron complex transport system substrate-binding protein